MAVVLGPFSLDRMARAMERVTERLARAAAALEAAGVPYAVIGGNAVASWVARVDPAGVRNTADVDLLLRREDLEEAGKALATAGFVPYELLGIPMFLDGIQGGPRDALHIILAGEKVRPDDLVASPQVSESVLAENSYRVVDLDALVRMKLTSFRDKDRTHLRDFIDVGLLDESWLARVPPVLAPRLQQLFDTPGG
jgi:Uncharacterised nucleotidyltransferase